MEDLILIIVIVWVWASFFHGGNTYTDKANGVICGVLTLLGAMMFCNFFPSLNPFVFFVILIVAMNMGIKFGLGISEMEKSIDRKFEEIEKSFDRKNAGHHAFASAGRQSHEEHFENTQAQGGAYTFDSSRFCSQKDADMHEYFKKRRDDQSSSASERMKCQEQMMKLENKGRENPKQLTAPN